MEFLQQINTIPKCISVFAGVCTYVRVCVRMCVLDVQARMSYIWCEVDIFFLYWLSVNF